MVAGSGDDTLVASSPLGNFDVIFGSGFARFVDTMTSGMDTQAGASATVTGGSGGGTLVLGDTGTDSDYERHWRHEHCFVSIRE